VFRYALIVFLKLARDVDVLDLFAQLNAKKKEVVDTDALIERYRKEIEELKARLAEREAVVPVRSRRLSAREVSLYLFFSFFASYWVFI